MKNILLLVLIAILFTTSCKKNNGLEPETLSSFPFEDTTLKIELVSSNVPSQCLDMYFFNESIGIIVTYDGKIFKTSDKGKTWILKFTNPTPDQPLNQILFVDQNTGYVAGGANWCHGSGCNCPGGLVLKTIDGGETWTILYQLNGQTEFDGITKNNNGDLFLIQNGFAGPSQDHTRILKSIDGGYNWTAVASFNFKIVKLMFNENYGFCTGGNDSAKIIRSSDNGDSWSDTTTFQELWVTDIAFSNNVGYCLSNNMFVYQTTDNGENWIQVSRPSEYSSYKLNLLSSSSCLLFGLGQYTGGCFGRSSGAVRQTTNSGISWSDNQFKDIGGIRYTSFYSSTEGYALTDGLLKVTVK